MVTLCPTTYEIASKMDNFSAWIRNKLRELDEYTPQVVKKTKELRCKECECFVNAEWHLFIDGREGWFGYCPTCDVDKTWIPKRR